MSDPHAAVSPVSPPLRYHLGFDNDFASEAIEGALPIGQNSPQKPPLGLVSELVSGSSFAAPRAVNRRSYLFRIHPSATQGAFEPTAFPTFLTPPLDPGPYPGAARWLPADPAEAETDFIAGIFTLCGNGAPYGQSGMAVHSYVANRSMGRRAFANADAENLVLPQQGALRIITEVGILEVAPGEVALIPKGMKFRVDLVDGPVRGFLCENFGHPLILPELGLIGSHGLANTIDFQVPVAAYEDVAGDFELIQKFAGRFWRAPLDHSPFDVVAWRGNWTASKFDMQRFNAMGTVTVDHPDPSIYCALHSPSDPTMGANMDFMILPPRWNVAEHSFRPPGYHRNAVAEFLSVVIGDHDARATNFPPGAASLHNNWTPHGPDIKTYEAGREGSLAPAKLDGVMVFMLESRFPLHVAAQALAAPNRVLDPHRSWQGFQRRFAPNGQPSATIETPQNLGQGSGQ